MVKPMRCVWSSIAPILVIVSTSCHRGDPTDVEVYYAHGSDSPIALGHTKNVVSTMPSDGELWTYVAAELGEDIAAETAAMHAAPAAALSTPAEADVNLDGVVDLRDIVLIATRFGATVEQPHYNHAADIDRSGEIGISDLVVVAIHFGKKVEDSIPSGPDTRTDGAQLVYEPPPGESAQNPAFAPDGDLLLFTLFHRGYNVGPAGLYLLSLRGADARLLLDEVDQDSVNLPGTCWNAVVGRITFSSDRQDRDEIWTMDSDASALVRLTHTEGGRSLEPSYSPDGGWIVFQTADADAEDRASLWKIRSDGSALTRLTNGEISSADDRQPNWSPVSDTILFQRRLVGTDDWDLYTIAADATDLRRVTDTPASDTDASWSPTGRSIVYSSDVGGLPAPNVFVISAQGGEPTRVTWNDAHEDSAPSWSPDGNWIAFESHPGTSDTPAALWRIEVPVMPTGDAP